MSIRQTHILHDIQKCVYSLINKLCSTTSPWTSWSAVKGWPESDVFTDFTKPFIYVETPMLISDAILQQGGGSRTKQYSLMIGCWDDRKTGGAEEISIMSGYMVSYFNDADCMTATFDVTLATANPDTTLLAQGIVVEGLNGPRVISTEDVKEFRREFELTVIA